MAAEWTERALGDLTQNFDQVRVPVKEADRRPGPYPYYGASGIVDYVDDYLLDGEYLLIAEDGENLRTRTTPIAFLARGRFWVNNHAHIVRGNEESDTRFLMYALAGADISGYLTGSAMPKLTQGNMNRIPLLVPPPAEQRAIAKILGTLDDKIDLNRRMSTTLDATVRALFKAWFIDFGPVQAKSAGRDVSVPSHLGALFPERFVNAEQGDLPEGWALEPLSAHVEVTKGVSYQGDGLGAQGVPLHNLNSILEGGGYKYEGIKYYAGDYRPRHIVRPGDVIVANTEQGHDRLLIGYAAMVPKLFGEFGIASHHVYRVTIKPGSPFRPAFVCAMLNSRRMHDVVSGFANGTTVNMLPEDGLQMPLAVVPPPALIEAFDTFARNSEQRREEMVAESRTLAAMRDALLPKLISGELRVPDPDTFLERVRA